VDDPADLGQQPDGDAEPARRTGSEAVRTPATALTRGAAMRTPMFWVIGGALAVTSGVGTGLNFHQIDLLGEQGLSPLEAAANFLPQTVGILASTLLVGALIDSFNERWLLLLPVATLAAAMLMVPHVEPGGLAIIYGLMLGSAGSSARAIEAALTPRFYGLTHLGSIRGVMRLFNVAASALGPLVVALGRETTGSYGGLLVTLLVLPAMVGVAALLVPRPTPLD
jgi:hypothetical protein